MAYPPPMYPNLTPYGQSYEQLSVQPYPPPSIPQYVPPSVPQYGQPNVQPYGNPYGQPNVQPYGNPYGQPYVQPIPVRRYQIRQKVFSFGDKFTITDEVGLPVFTVRGKVFSLGRKLALEDMAGNGLIKIQQELLHLHRTYKILSGRNGESDRELATVRKKFSFINKKFSIESVYGEYTIEGIDYFQHAYVIKRQGQLVATISRAFFTIADTYGVEIVGNEDHVFIIALAIVIDQVLAEDEQNQANRNNNMHHHPH